MSSVRLERVEPNYRDNYLQEARGIINRLKKNLESLVAECETKELNYINSEINKIENDVSSAYAYFMREIEYINRITDLRIKEANLMKKLKEMQDSITEEKNRLIKECKDIIYEYSRHGVNIKINNNLDQQRLRELRNTKIEIQNRVGSDFRELINHIVDLQKSVGGSLKNNLDNLLSQAAAISNKKDLLANEVQILFKLRKDIENLNEYHSILKGIDTSYEKIEIKPEDYQSTEDEIIRKKDRIALIIDQISSIDEDEARILKQKYADYSQTNDTLKLSAIESKLESIRSNLKTKKAITEIYKDQILNIMEENRDSEAILNLSNAILKNKYISDEEFLEFIEQVANIKAKAVKEKETLIAKSEILEELKAMGYKIYDENGEEIHDLKELKVEKIIQILPGNFDGFLIRGKCNKNSEIIFKLIIDESKESQATEFENRWCEDIKKAKELVKRKSDNKEVLTAVEERKSYSKSKINKNNFRVREMRQ